MLLEKSHCESNIFPNDLEVKNLGGSIYYIVKNDNVEVFEKSQDGVIETFYNCDKTILRGDMRCRAEAIVAFIRLRYSQNDEFALTNKGIANNQDINYIAYREYVAWCKEQAAVYFNFER